MWATISAFAKGRSPGPSRWLRFSLFVVLFLGLNSCSLLPTQGEAEPPMEFQLAQKWELQPGDEIGGRTVRGGLGDISIELQGNAVYAPFQGKVQRDKRNCAIFTSPDVPAYMFRLCGLISPAMGTMPQGKMIGRGHMLEFATLRKQPDGKWALVEPSKQVLELTLNPQSQKF
jgi:hypothetical protein